MNYWHMQIHADNTNWGKEEKLLEKRKLIGLGDWEEHASQQSQFENEMKKGDIVLIRRTVNPIALVRVVGEYKYEKQTDDLAWFQRRREIEILGWYEDDEDKFENIPNLPAQGTLQRLSSPDKDTYKLIDKWYKIAKERKYMILHKELLETNKNVILNGAPGTGKTYLAQQIAEEITGNEITKNNNQYAFVQFHPSYDYTDFVEGLRPFKNDGGELGFELKNGIFKDLCKKAKEAEDEDKSEEYKRKFVIIIDEINRAEISKVFGELFFSIDPGYRGEKGKVKTQYTNMQTKETCFTNKDDDYFYVPENVYIIGTMNDIDRSVENMDFAMRRRFAFKELEANEQVHILNQIPVFKAEAQKRMQALNDAIDEVDGLDSSYHIGPAYFLKLEHYKDKENPFKYLWDNHIKMLLKDYLRGLPKVDVRLNELENVYYNPSGQSSDNTNSQENDQ